MLKNIRLERPLDFIDGEISGLNHYSDRIVELSIPKVYPDHREEYKSHRMNPSVPIPTEASAVHGITDADVAEEPKFQQYTKSIRDFLDGCDIVGLSVIQFDLPCLEAEFARVDVEFSRRGRQLVDSKVNYHQRDPRDLQAAYQKYCGKDMESAHSAEEDAKAAAEVLDGQLEMHDDLPRDVLGLCALCYVSDERFIDSEGKFIWVEDEAILNFGKYEGHSLRQIATEHPDYLEWILRKDFSAEVRYIAMNAMASEFPEP
jgi:DNA polymerase-3 subunit epsilon